MKRSRLEEIICEEIYKFLAEMNISSELHEKSVPEPYKRKERRRMNKSQITTRDTIGKAMKDKPSTVKYFKKKFGSDWESYLWATATSRAIKGGDKK